MNSFFLKSFVCKNYKKQLRLKLRKYENTHNMVSKSNQSLKIIQSFQTILTGNFIKKECYNIKQD